MREFVVALGASVILAAQALPPDLAQKLDLARTLPPGMAAPVMVSYIQPAKIGKEAKAALALEVYLMATGSGVDPMKVYAVRQNSGPLDWATRVPAHLRNPQGAALLAWSIYHENYDKARQKPLDFPARRIVPPETCRAMLVDDPIDYFEGAWRAGPHLFAQAAASVRNPIEYGRLLQAVVQMSPGDRPIQAVLAPLSAFVPDRHFAYAMEFTPLHNALMKIALETSGANARTILGRYAAFLERHWVQKRCRGNENMSYGGLIQDFNKTAAAAEEQFNGMEMPRLAEDAGEAKDIETDSYSEGEADLRDLVLLRLKIEGTPQDDVNFTTTLSAVGSFRPPDRLPNTAKLLQKNFAYRELLTHCLNSPNEMRTMEAWLAYFVESRAMREAPQVWMATVRDVVEWVGKDSGRRKMAGSAGDPALASLLQLEVLDAQ